MHTYLHNSVFNTSNTLSIKIIWKQVLKVVAVSIRLLIGKVCLHVKQIYIIYQTFFQIFLYCTGIITDKV